MRTRPVARIAPAPKWHSRALEERIARADAASADIKSFNEYVNQHGFREVVSIEVSGEPPERLCWQPLSGNSWGLTHHCNVASAGGTMRKATPLIECTMDVRLRMAKLLQRLLAEIDRHVFLQEEVPDDVKDPEDD